MKFKHKLMVRNNPNLNNEKCPLPLNIIPNYMGIGLCSVDWIKWNKTKDGQMIDLHIKFVPYYENGMRYNNIIKKLFTFLDTRR